MIDRPQHLITLDDLGDRIVWEIEEDDKVVAKGAVELPPHLPMQNERIRMLRAFTNAWEQAESKRRELLSNALTDERSDS